MSFISKDFLNTDANCPDYFITAFEMIEMLKTQGAEGKMNHDPQLIKCTMQKPENRFYQLCYPNIKFS